MSDHARALTQQAVPQAKRAGTTAVQGVRQGVEGARGWAAPRIHDAADAITASVAPKVSSALHSAAKTVEPVAPGRRGIRRLFDWRLMVGVGAAVVAACAAAAVALRQRYESATMAAEDSETDVANKADDPTGEVPGQAEDAKRSEANGRVAHGTRR